MKIWMQLLAMACWLISAQVAARTQHKIVLFIAVDDLGEDKGSSKAKDSSTHFACEHQVNLSFHLQENEVIKTIFAIMVLLTTSTAHAEPNIVFLFADRYATRGPELQNDSPAGTHAQLNPAKRLTAC